MSLSVLIENQSIIIDDHKRGNQEIKNWDDLSVDVHIDKKTNYPINGKRQNVRIRIPINSERPIIIENGKKQRLDDIPSQLRKEIRNALENNETRENFLKDLINTIKNFDSILDNEERARQILKNLSRHFNLKWNKEKIATYVNDILQVYTEIYVDKNETQFFITVDREKIKIGQSNAYARHQKIIERR